MNGRLNPTQIAVGLALLGLLAFIFLKSGAEKQNFRAGAESRKKIMSLLTHQFGQRVDSLDCPEAGMKKSEWAEVPFKYGIECEREIGQTWISGIASRDVNHVSFQPKFPEPMPCKEGMFENLLGLKVPSIQNQGDKLVASFPSHQLGGMAQNGLEVLIMCKQGSSEWNAELWIPEMRQPAGSAEEEPFPVAYLPIQVFWKALRYKINSPRPVPKPSHARELEFVWVDQAATWKIYQESLFLNSQWVSWVQSLSTGTQKPDAFQDVLKDFTSRTHDQAFFFQRLETSAKIAGTVRN